jgi:ammonium transporter, Amt family
VGWLGFDSGGALAADGRAGMAVLATQMAAAGAALSWSFAEWFLRAKPSVLGAISGAVARLVAITPASGFVLPGPALAIGIVAGAVCFWAATVLKPLLGYDDSMDVFGVHGVGGIVGMLGAGILAYGPLTATEAHPGGTPIGGLQLLGVQALGVVVTLGYGAAASFVLLKLTDVVVGLRCPASRSARGWTSCCTGGRCSEDTQPRPTATSPLTRERGSRSSVPRRSARRAMASSYGVEITRRPGWVRQESVPAAR